MTSSRASGPGLPRPRLQPGRPPVVHALRPLPVRPAWAKNRLTPALAPSHAAAPAHRSPAETRTTSLIGPSSRMTRLIKPRAGRPLRTLVSTVLSSRAVRNAARCGGNILASGQNRKAVPIWTPAAPNINAATSSRASAMPPVAMTGILTASTTCGSKANRPTCVAMSSLRNIPR